MAMKQFGILLLTCVLLFGDSSAEDGTAYSYIDDAHEVLSENILQSSKYIDDTLSGWVSGVDSIIEHKDNNQSNILSREVQKIDSFYKNEKFMEDTDKSFIRIRATSKVQSMGEDDNNINIKARLSLYKSRKNIKLFIEEEDADDKDIDGVPDGNSKIYIGLSYLTPEYYSITSKYKLGFSGFNPYVSARYKIKYEINGWLIEPVQKFKYKIKDKEFKEETDIYFDTKLDKSRLFRIKLSRGTKSNDDGMDYGAALIYYYLTGKKASLNVSQSFSGNTKYKYEDKNDQTISYHGINTYSTNVSWRHSVWKKWFFYEIKPGVDFSKVNDYKANYKVVFLTDFYFGYY